MVLAHRKVDVDDRGGAADPVEAPHRAGLSSAEARSRLRAHGPNLTSSPPARRLLARLVRRLLEPLVAILLLAAAIAGATGDLVSLAMIVLIVLVSIVLEAVQEHRAERAVEALRRSIALRSRVKRDGLVRTLPVEEIVPGDVVLLGPGDLVPADGIVIESRGASANEALLTGEPYPVGKRAVDAVSPGSVDASGALFGGTAIVSGEAVLGVTATGSRTRFGGIAAALAADEPPTAFERGLRSLGELILRATVFLVLFVLLAHLAFHRPPLESFMFAVALAVGLTPELLPMVTTVTLARGAARMAKRKVIIRRLAAIHDLGAMDVLCTDKTGTLTEARIALVGQFGPDGADSRRVVEWAAVNSRLSGGASTALDEAILAAADQDTATAWRRIADLPFDFERRRASVLAERNGRRFLVVKGAPEAVLEICVALDGADEAGTLDTDVRTKLAALHEAEAARGRRLLGVAMREVDPATSSLTPADERDLTFVGFCAFLDPPKASAGPAIARLRDLGVRIKIISGDAAAVARHLAGELGLTASDILTGAEIAGMSDAALLERAKQTDLFARVAPEQKMRIIRALRKGGSTVGYIGDGINDAPALKAADCGVSVDGAADVARAAADVILLEHDLRVLADGVEEGRRTYANIVKYVRMGASSNFGNMLSMALASLFIPFLPLTAVQVLLNNLLYDLSETGIPFDEVDAAEIKAPHGWDMGALLRFMLVMGPLSSLFDIATFTILLQGFGASPETFRTAWFVESITTQILVIFIIRTGGPFWASQAHPALVATSLGALAVGLFAALGPIGPWIGFAPPPWLALAAIGALALLYLALAEALKPLATVARGSTPRPPPAG